MLVILVVVIFIIECLNDKYCVLRLSKMSLWERMQALIARALLIGSPNIDSAYPLCSLWCWVSSATSLGFRFSPLKWKWQVSFNKQAIEWTLLSKHGGKNPINWKNKERLNSSFLKYKINCLIGIKSESISSSLRKWHGCYEAVGHCEQTARRSPAFPPVI